MKGRGKRFAAHGETFEARQRQHLTIESTQTLGSNDHSSIVIELPLCLPVRSLSERLNAERTGPDGWTDRTAWGFRSEMDYLGARLFGSCLFNNRSCWAC